VAARVEEALKRAATAARRLEEALNRPQQGSGPVVGHFEASCCTKIAGPSATRVEWPAVRYFPAERTSATLPELYDAALDVIQDAIMCDGISIFELADDGRSLEFVATRTFARDLLKGLELPLGTGLAGRCAAEGRGLVSNRAHSHPDFFAVPDQSLAFRTRSVLCSPMRHGGELVGVIELVNKVDRGDFVEGELRSVEALAAGAAANWRGAGSREAFYELTRMLRKIVDVEGVSIFTLEEGGENLVLRFSDTTRKTDLVGTKLGLDQGVAAAVARGREPLLVPDVDREPRFFEGVDAVSMFATRSIAAAPVLFGERLLAVVELVNGRGGEAFTERDLGVLRRIAAELAERMHRAPSP
jgi:GAF domain-containing protein